jgi:hypothetical protein
VTFTFRNVELWSHEGRTSIVNLFLFLAMYHVQNENGRESCEFVVVRISRQEYADQKSDVHRASVVRWSCQYRMKRNMNQTSDEPRASIVRWSYEYRSMVSKKKIERDLREIAKSLLFWVKRFYIVYFRDCHFSKFLKKVTLSEDVSNKGDSAILQQCVDRERRGSRTQLLPSAALERTRLPESNASGGTS